MNENSSWDWNVCRLSSWKVWMTLKAPLCCTVLCKSLTSLADFYTHPSKSTAWNWEERIQLPDKHLLVTHPRLKLLLFTFDTHPYCSSTLVFSKMPPIFITMLTSAEQRWIKICTSVCHIKCLTVIWPHI